jgi:hypothetical protein
MRPLAERLAVAALLLALAAQLGYGLRADGVTNDEVLYAAAGWRQVAQGDYRLNTTHPPLAPDVAALGLLGLRPQLPPFAPGDDVLAYSYRFLHVANDAGAVITRARGPVLLLSLLLALLSWWWAREAAGPAAGLLALFFLAFHPTLLAHGHLATTDLPSTFAMLAASYLFFRWTRRPGPAWAAATAVAVGLAGATRLTALGLLPCFTLLAGWRVLRARGPERAAALRQAAVFAGLLAVLLPLSIWCAYGFHDPPAVPTRTPGLAGRVLDAAERLHVVPAAYVEAVRFQVDHNRRGHLAYLLGQRSRQGWRSYFAVAFLVKSTPGWLAALLLAALCARRVRAPGTEHWLPPALVAFAAVSLGHIQIGERYLLPVHVYLALWAATRLGPAVARVRPAVAAAALAVVLGAHALPALAILPRGHLAYFNALAGGPDGGHRVLLDSNLDWGQDLPRLARWMREQGVRSVRLAYMGADDPRRFGIAADHLPGANLYAPPLTTAPLSGTVVVSPNLLFGLVPPVAPLYAPLRDRPPDARAGVFFVYNLP